MSASLVGSEMCIRDSIVRASPPAKQCAHAISSMVGRAYSARARNPLLAEAISARALRQRLAVAKGYGRAE
eukprot:4661136-Alexandrium_andersonii.AAC.1